MVSYDIENDRLRAKTANKLLEYGFIRLQKSVFAGTIQATPWKGLLAWLNKEVVGHFEPNDRLLYLPLAEGQSERLVFLPEPPPEWLDTINPPNTLFV